MTSKSKKISLLIIAVVVSLILSFVSLPVWAISPGKAQEVAKLIKIENTKTSSSGHILMTDVSLGPVSPLLWIIDKFNPNVDLVPSSEILGNKPPSSFVPTGLDQMKQSKEAAIISALSYLGYNLHKVHGAIVAGIAPSSVVSSKLHPGDLITKIDSSVVNSAPQFVSDISKHLPKESISLTYIPASLVPDRPKDASVYKTTTVVLGAKPGDSSKPYLGIKIGDGVSYRAPLKITISTPGIGGPSAGLAFTLGIIDQLKGGNLTRGKMIAATGTISPDGSVGDVGGVPQKTIAVERAGARLFLVPPEEYKAALSKATPALKVESVSTLAQAVADIRAFSS